MGSSRPLVPTQHLHFKRASGLQGRPLAAFRHIATMQWLQPTYRTFTDVDNKSGHQCRQRKQVPALLRCYLKGIARFEASQSSGLDGRAALKDRVVRLMDIIRCNPAVRVPLNCRLAARFLSCSEKLISSILTALCSNDVRRSAHNWDTRRTKRRFN